MFRIAACLVVAVSLAGCGMISTLIEGWKYAQAVETELEASTGMKPQVGFHWKNGRLIEVSVVFPALYQKKPLPELAEMVRRSVNSQFKQTANTIVLAFELEQSENSVKAVSLDRNRQPDTARDSRRAVGAAAALGAEPLVAIGPHRTHQRVDLAVKKVVGARNDLLLDDDAFLGL